MKLRYVFPLLLAAAVGGGAFVHFRAEIEGRLATYKESRLSREEKHRLEEQRYMQAHEDAYRKIAEGILWACAPISEFPIFNSPKELEARWRREAEKLLSREGVSRQGPRLTIKTATGEVHLDDSGYFCHSKEGSRYEYIELLPKSGFHFIMAHQYEWQTGVLISAKTGRRHDTELQVEESPNGKRLTAFTGIGWRMGDEAGGPVILRIEGDDLVREYPIFNPDPYAPDPPDRISISEFVGWIDDARLLVTLAGREGQHVIVFNKGKWQLAAPLSK